MHAWLRYACTRALVRHRAERCGGPIRFILAPRAHSVDKSARGNEPPRPAVPSHADSMMTNGTEAAGADPTPRGSNGRDCARSPHAYFCVKHAPKHSVHYSQLCSRPHCFKVASYVSEQRELRHSNFQLHRRSVSAAPTLMCISPRRQVFCAAHAPEGVFDYRHLLCCATGCNRQGIWIDPLTSASHTVEAYCHVHRHDTMVLRSTFRRQDASMPASEPKSKGAAWQGNVSSAASATEMRLLGSGNHGQSTRRVAQLCLDVAVRSSSARGEDARRRRGWSYLKCKHPLGCELFASFGVPGDKPRFCASHKAAHHTNQLRKSCMVQGCSARAMFGVDSLLTHCGAHRSLSFRTRVSACVWSCVRECARAPVAVSQRGTRNTETSSHSLVLIKVF